MKIARASQDQVRDWLHLAELADEVGDNLPCRQAPDLFFATLGEIGDTMMAKKACQTCPIKGPCGEYAIKHREPEGTWGGMTAGERRRLRSRKNR